MAAGKTNKTRKTEVKLTLDVRAGPVSPAQKTVWKRFWSNLIAEAKVGEGADNHTQPSSAQQDAEENGEGGGPSPE